MDERKPSPKPTSGAYVPPHRRYYPRTEGVQYQLTKKQRFVAPTHESYDDNLYSPRQIPQQGSTNVTPATTVSRISSQKSTNPTVSGKKTPPRYIHTHVETVNSSPSTHVPTDPPTSVAFSTNSHNLHQLN